MSPVEGEKSFNGQLVSKLDSTEPGTSQRFFDLFPAVLNLQCNGEDTRGGLVVENNNPDIKVRKTNQNPGEEESGIHIEFSGDQRVTIEHSVPNTDFTEELTFWHHTGESEQPPNRSERVPINPAPPLDEKEEGLIPEEKREIVSAVSKR